MAGLTIERTDGEPLEPGEYRVSGTMVVEGTEPPIPPEPTDWEIVCPDIDSPDSTHGSHKTRWYSCHFTAHEEVNAWGLEMPVSYMIPPEENFHDVRLRIFMHPTNSSGAYVKRVDGNFPGHFQYLQDTLEIHSVEDMYEESIGGWWGYSGHQKQAVDNYNGLRLSWMIDEVIDRHPGSIDLKKGIHLEGESLGGTGAILQAMILPHYQDKVAIVESYIGNMLMCKNNRDKIENSWGDDHYDFADFRIQYHKVTNVHFHWAGSTNDHLGEFDLEFIEICEREKISCSAVWLMGGHSWNESGYNISKKLFTSSNQDARLDQILPVITNNSSNYHGVDRGYHNRGINWDSTAIADNPTGIVVPLKYTAMKDIGPELPDQPETATFSLTLRRAKNVLPKMDWVFGGQSGTVEAVDGLVTIDGLSLTSGAGYSLLSLTTADTGPDPEPEPIPGGLHSKVPFHSEGNRLVSTRSYGRWGRYERFRRFVHLPTTVELSCTDIESGGAKRTLEGSYRMTWDGEPVSEWVDASGVTTLSIPLHLDKFDQLQGAHDVQLMPESTNVTDECIPYWYRVGEGDPEQLSIALYSRDSFKKHLDHMDALVPARYVPTAMPLTKRIPVPFDSTINRHTLYWEKLALHPGNHIPRRIDGELTAANRQRYFYSDFVDTKPCFQMFDGPRGVGIQQNPTHIMVDVHGNPYCCSPWSIYRIDREGNIRTRVGYRHNKKTLELELVGDWSNIPVERWGMSDLWGLWWDERTTATDPTIDTEGLTVSPHRTPPIMYWPDPPNNRILKAVMNDKDHMAEPTIYEFITEGLDDPWDITGLDGVMYISERGANRISKWSVDTGEYLGDLVSSPGTWIDKDKLRQTRIPYSLVSEEKAKTLDCMCPSGIFMQDDYIYWGHQFAKRVSRIHKDGGAVEHTFQNMYLANTTAQSFYYKFCLSDGSFGPRGTLFLTTWDNRWTGVPHIKYPDGTKGEIMSYSSKRVDVGASNSAVSHHASNLYNTACGIGNGSLFIGTCHTTFYHISKEQPGDTLVDTVKYYAGRAKWMKDGSELLYGPNGQNPYGLEMPDVIDDEVAYYLEMSRL